MGLLAGLGLEAEFSGDDSINRRPMDRVQKPLLDMGADIRLKNEKYPPVHIYPKPLKAIDYDMPVASAQVKRDRKSTRLNSSHVSISYAVFCLKKKKKRKMT